MSKSQKKKKKVGQQEVEVESCSLSTLKLYYNNIMKKISIGKNGETLLFTAKLCALI